MRDIADPASPFADKYSAWDRWIYEQALARIGQNTMGARIEGAQWYSAVVTLDGFIKPQLAELEEGLARLSGALPPSTEHCVNQISCYGIMDEALKAELTAERSRIWAAAYPDIPDWLAAAPAIRNMVLPSGEVVTLGPLGSGVPGPEGKTPGYSQAQAYHRYSAAGELLGQTLTGEMWQALFVPDWTAGVLIEQLKAQRLPRVLKGCTVFENRETQAPELIISYDGQSIAPEAGMDSLPPALLTEITAQQVVEIHYAQN